MPKNLAVLLIALAFIVGFTAGSFKPLSPLVNYDAFSNKPDTASPLEEPELAVNPVVNRVNTAFREAFNTFGSSNLKSGLKNLETTIGCSKEFTDKVRQVISSPTGESFSCTTFLLKFVGIVEFTVWKSPLTGAHRIVWQYKGEVTRHMVDENCGAYTDSDPFSYSGELIIDTPPPEEDWVLVCQDQTSLEFEIKPKWRKSCPCANPAEPPEQS